MSNQNRTEGRYSGTMPEDIYIRLGEIWHGAGGPLQTTQKIYITKANHDYDIEVHGVPLGKLTAGAVATLKASPAKTGTPYSLEVPDNLDPSTPEYLLSMGVGDVHRAHNIYDRKVVSKTFRQPSGGPISIDVVYDK